MTQLGLAITFLTTTILVIGFFRHRQRRLAFYGLAGLIGLLSGEILVVAGIQPVAIYFTPIAWTCYILLADAAVLAMRGIPVCTMLPGSLPGLHYSQFHSGWFLRLTIFVCKTGHMLVCPKLGRSHCSAMRGHLRRLRPEFLKLQT